MMRDAFSRRAAYFKLRVQERRFFERRCLFQTSCSREALNRRGALIRERALIRSNTVFENKCNLLDLPVARFFLALLQAQDHPKINSNTYKHMR